MNPVLIYKTPIWKEIVSISLFLVFGVAGGVLIYLAYTEGEVIAYVLGGILLVTCIPAAIMEAMSRTVLKLDAEGIYAHPQIFSKKQRIPWRNISGFEKVVQELKSHKYTDSTTVTYLVISLKEAPDTGTLGAHVTSSLNAALGVDKTLDKPYQRGSLYFPSMRLPGKVDDILREVREYHAHITGEPVVPTIPESSRKKKLVTAWIFLAGALLFAALFLLTTITGKSLVDSGADIVLFFQNI